MSWPLKCKDCGRSWTLEWPPLPIRAEALVRILKAHSRCVYCNSTGVQIVLTPGGES